MVAAMPVACAASRRSSARWSYRHSRRAIRTELGASAFAGHADGRPAEAAADALLRCGRRVSEVAGVELGGELGHDRSDCELVGVSMGESGGQPELAALNGEPLVGQLHVLHAGQYGATT